MQFCAAFQLLARVFFFKRLSAGGFFVFMFWELFTKIGLNLFYYIRITTSSEKNWQDFIILICQPLIRQAILKNVYFWAICCIVSEISNMVLFFCICFLMKLQYWYHRIDFWQFLVVILQIRTQKIRQECWNVSVFYLK